MFRKLFSKKTKSIVALAAMATILMTSVAPVSAITVDDAKESSTKEEAKLKYRNVMYYGDWSIWEGQSKFYPENIPADQITHLNFAFMDFNADGSLKWTDESAATGHPLNHVSDVTYDDLNGGILNSFKALKRMNPNLKIGISLGGWSKSGDFTAVSKNPTARKKFVANVLAFIKYANMDFVDIDWEYPGAKRDPDLCDNARDEGTKDGSPADKQYFVDLLQEFRTELDKQGKTLGKTYELTAALPAPVQKVKDGIDVPKVFELLDFANIMTYDMRGAWEPIAAHQAGLYNNPKDPDIGKGLSVDDSVKYYLSQGAKSDKIVIGAAYYTRGWEKVKNTGVDPKNPGLFGEAEICATDADLTKTSGAEPEAILKNGEGGRRTGTWSYNNIFSKIPNSSTRSSLIGMYPNLKEYWDDYAKAPYLYDPNNGAFFTYDNVRSIQEKVKYVKEKNLGGMIAWMASQDRPTDPNSPVRDELTKATKQALYGNIELPKYKVTDMKPDVSVSNVTMQKGDFGTGGTLNFTITNNNKCTESDSVVAKVEKSTKTLMNPKVYVKTKSLKLTTGNYPTPTPKFENGYYVFDYTGVYGLKMWAPGESRTFQIKTDSYIDNISSEIVSIGISQTQFSGTPEFGKVVMYGDSAEKDKIDANGNYYPTIIGLEDKRITIYDKFNPLEGITANDLEDGDLTSKLKVDGIVDVNKLGQYVLNYSVTDSKGATRTWSITITVGKKQVIAPDDYNPSKNYVKGDIVVYKGHRYELVYYTGAGFPPDTPVAGIWKDLGEALIEIDIPKPNPIIDLATVAENYNRRKGEISFNEKCDFNSDGIVDIYDIVSISRNL
ncbi:glycosyl hydrolase family 18 protein [Clostridium paraputrificum]|uniref:glycosyl hydrolase family 18 protein n=1 Tax=Clostridium TaxID=1485 RepID=UPI003D33C9E0